MRSYLESPLPVLPFLKSFDVCSGLLMMKHWEQGALARIMATLVPLFQLASVEICYSALAMHVLEEKARSPRARQKTSEAIPPLLEIYSSQHGSSQSVQYRNLRCKCACQGNLIDLRSYTCWSSDSTVILSAGPSLVNGAIC